MITSLPLNPKKYEAKLSLQYKHTNKENYIQFPSCSTVFEISIWTSDWWTLKDMLIGINQQRENFLQASEI